MSGGADGLGDFPVVCTESGDVRVLASILQTPRNGPAELLALREDFYRVGRDARVVGRTCPTCRQYGNVKFCEYRPLRGPLFVPR